VICKKYFIFALSFTFLAVASGDLSYRKREHRYEGKVLDPIGVYRIELLGAAVEPVPETATTFSEEAVIRFFLAQEEPVHIVVQEQAPQHFYRLDKVEPPRPWRSGATNSFAWPATEVLLPLGLKPADLLVLVRLGQADPAREERVAPALFHPTASPGPVETYRFTFHVNVPSRLWHTVYAAGSGKPVTAERVEGERSPGGEYVIVWNASGQPEGTYRLVVEGKARSNYRKFDRVVTFFHTPSWPG